MLSCTNLLHLTNMYNLQRVSPGWGAARVTFHHAQHTNAAFHGDQEHDTAAAPSQWILKLATLLSLPCHYRPKRHYRGGANSTLSVILPVQKKKSRFVRTAFLLFAPAIIPPSNEYTASKKDAETVEPLPQHQSQPGSLV